MTRDGIEYGRAGQVDAYLYSPVFAQVIRPLTLLDWPVFYGAWTALLVSSVILIVGPLWAALLIALPPVSGEIVTGNIHLLLTAAVMLGLRHPEAWAFPLLTKLTPGVGLVWFCIRRQWAAFRTAAVATLVLVAISLVLDPGAWAGWLEALLMSPSTPGESVPIPIAVRLPAALAIVAIGAWRGWHWTVLVATALAMPVLWSYQWRWSLPLIGLIALARGHTTLSHHRLFSSWTNLSLASASGAKPTRKRSAVMAADNLDGAVSESSPSRL